MNNGLVCSPSAIENGVVFS